MKRWRWIALLLCALLTVSVFAACETKPQAESSTVSVDGPVGMTKQLLDHLGERDLEGFELVILSTTEEYAFGDIQFATDELNSDPVNDAIFERNNLIEDLYNCKITVQFCGEGEPFLERVTTDCLSGTVNYQVVASGISSTGIPKLALDGLIQDLYAIEDSHLQLDGDWWDQNAIDDLSIGNKLFFASGDIAVTDDEMTTMLVFNKELIEENQLEDPYQLVRDDKWTMDKMYEMCKAVAKDGGDGVMNIAGEEDTWGLIGAAFDCYRLILGGNAPIQKAYAEEMSTVLCFVAGTAVKAEEGDRAIEEIKVGDRVWSYSPETGETALKQVTRTFVNETDRLVRLIVNGEEILTTPEHPFYVPHSVDERASDWGLGSGWLRAADLRAGDVLYLLDGSSAIVESVEQILLDVPVTVYNFEVEHFHSYFVSPSGLLVHNTCPDENQKIIQKWGKDYKKTGISENDAMALWELAVEYNVPGHAPGYDSYKYGYHMKIYNYHINIIS